MKIGQGPELPVAVSSASLKKAEQEKDAAPASVAQTAARATPTAGASVSVSNLARTLEQTDKGVGADFDSKKVATIRAAIAGGTYTVNPEAIADKLLSNAQEMLNVTEK
ncbi:flagellar biosynthesis anti-sigma factor FlgM [Rhodoferax sp.]|uniref:flagellar biosynthesis anti-sigma factor FlgM n=1 Tax=Rhodoferax sp. TaxID=50421 RepID=UPI00374D8AE6